MFSVSPFSDEETEAWKGQVTDLSTAIQLLSISTMIQTQSAHRRVCDLKPRVTHSLQQRGGLGHIADGFERHGEESLQVVLNVKI